MNGAFVEFHTWQANNWNSFSKKNKSTLDSLPSPCPS